MNEPRIVRVEADGVSVSLPSTAHHGAVIKFVGKHDEKQGFVTIDGERYVLPVVATTVAEGDHVFWEINESSEIGTPDET